MTALSRDILPVAELIRKGGMRTCARFPLGEEAASSPAGEEAGDSLPFTLWYARSKECCGLDIVATSLSYATLSYPCLFPGTFSVPLRFSPSTF